MQHFPRREPAVPASLSLRFANYTERIIRFFCCKQIKQMFVCSTEFTCPNLEGLCTDTSNEKQEQKQKVIMPTKDDSRFYFFSLFFFCVDKITFVNVRPSKRKYFIASRIPFACTRNALARCGLHLCHYSAEPSRAGVSHFLLCVSFFIRFIRAAIAFGRYYLPFW